MPWFKIDDGFYSHPKVVSIPRSVRLAAIGTWTLAGTWSADHLTDGLIPLEQIEELGGSLDGARALVKAKLWTKTRTGFRFESWDDYQPTKAQVEEARESERTRKAQQRAKAKGHQQESRLSPTGSPAVVPVGHTGTSHGTEAGVRTPRPVPSRPDPTMNHVSPSSHVLDRASSEQTTDDEADRSRREAYWRGWGISNPLRVMSALIGTVSRPVSEDQAISIVAGILSRAKQRPDSTERYVLGAIRQSWAEIQQELDETPVSA